MWRGRISESKDARFAELEKAKVELCPNCHRPAFSKVFNQEKRQYEYKHRTPTPSKHTVDMMMGSNRGLTTSYCFVPVKRKIG
jgi:hypothetical protein